MLRHVDLCSGIGGFSLGFSWAELSKTIMFCDTEKWCRQILNKNFPNIPIATDVKELANDAEKLVPDHDILTAGYPCQPFSVAGLRKGEEDDRHIWPYIFRIVTQKRPSWCVFENVYGHVALGLDKVLADLESQGYATRTFIVPACAKNASHRRDRMWIIAKNVEDSIGGRCEERDSKSQEVSRSIRTSPRDGDGETLGDTSSGGRGRLRVSREEIGNSSSQEAQSVLASSVRGDVANSNVNQHKREDRRGDAEKKGDEEQKWTEHSSSWKSSRTSEAWLSHQGHAREQTMAYTKCLGWEQRSKEQGEFDREEPSDQFDFGSEGRTRSRPSSHVAYTNCEPEWGGRVSEQSKDEGGGRSKTRSEGLQSRNGQSRSSESEQSSEDVAYTSSEGLQGRTINPTINKGRAKKSQLGNEGSRVYTDEGVWFAEPNVGRVAHGIPKRVDRLKGLGNAIVPQLAMQIGLAIKAEIDENKKS
jgi:DNA (cytosine-5)-methyltransferase 1